MNTPVQEAVIASLALDPRIPNDIEVAVAVEGDTVILRGTVDDQLEVNLLGQHRRGVAELRVAVLQSLIWDAEVPADSVDAKVKHGWVTLTGYVEYPFQSAAAYEDAARLVSVTGISNQITVMSPS